jgi:hypothetical protein
MAQLLLGSINKAVLKNTIKAFLGGVFETSRW